VLGVLQ
jgi:hypothetical protein